MRWVVWGASRDYSPRKDAFLRNPKVSASFKHPLTACVKNVDHVCLFLEVWNIEGTQWGMTTVALLSGFLQGAVVDVDHVKKKGTRAMLVWSDNQHFRFICINVWHAWFRENMGTFSACCIVKCYRISSPKNRWKIGWSLVIGKTAL